MPPIKYLYLAILVPVSILVPITIGVYRYKNLGKAMNTIFFYLVLNGLISLLVRYLASYKMNNLPILHVFTILEFLCISIFYIQTLKDKMIKRIIVSMMVIFPLACVINFMYFQDITRFNTNTRPLEALLVMIYSLLYFAQNTNDTFEKKWEESPINWVSSGLLLYFSGALFIFSFSNYTSSDMNTRYQQLNLLIWNIHATLLLIMYLLFAKGFSKCTKK